MPTEPPPAAPTVVVSDSGGFRSRFARLAGSRPSFPELEPLLRTLRKYHPKADIRLVERAYEMAAYLHRDQKRRSGEATSPTRSRWPRSSPISG